MGFNKTDNIVDQEKDVDHHHHHLPIATNSNTLLFL